jgi:hypothetical protein
MKSHTLPSRFICIFGFCLLFYARVGLAQNEGIGTFSNLVSDARQTSLEPQPTPVVKTTLTKNFLGQTEAVTTTEPPPLFSGLSVGAEYDYRRTQQKAPGGLTIDVNEAHASFSFLLASTKLAFDYVHIWADGSNDIGGRQNVASNGIKLTITQPVGDNLVFALPVFYKNDDANAVISTGPQTFGVDTFVMNPFLVYSVKLPLLKDAAGQPEPPKKQPLALSFSPGYRFSVTQKHDIRPAAPDVDGWSGTFNALVGLDYAPTEKDGTNRWTISGAATWSHLARYYSSKAPRPDDNSFGLGASFTYVFSTFKETHQPQLTGKIGYQYDGFNNDFYQHSVTVIGTYRF